MIDHHVLVRGVPGLPDVPSLRLPPQLAPRTRPPVLPSLLLRTPARGGGGAAVPGGARPPGPLLPLGDQRRPFPAEIAAVQPPSPLPGHVIDTRGTHALLLSRYKLVHHFYMALGKYKLSLSLVTHTANYSYHITFQGSSGFIVPPHSQLNISDLICRVASCARSFRHRVSRQGHERTVHKFRKSNNLTFELICYINIIKDCVRE